MNHTHFPKEDQPPDRARWDNQVKKGWSCRITALTTARHQPISWDRSKPFLRNSYQYYPYVIRLTTLPQSCTAVMKSGNLNFLEISGPLQACNGTALPFFTLHPRLGLPSGVLPSDFNIKTLYVPFPIREICPAHFIFLDLITQTKFNEDHEVLLYVVSCAPLLPRLSQAQIRHTTIQT